jgi:hypothetical protein
MVSVSCQVSVNGLAYHVAMLEGRRVSLTSVCCKLYLLIINSLISADISDLELVDRLSSGKVDLTYGRWVRLLFSEAMTVSLTTAIARQRTGHFWRQDCQV